MRSSETSNIYSVVLFMILVPEICCKRIPQNSQLMSVKNPLHSPENIFKIFLNFCLQKPSCNDETSSFVFEILLKILSNNNNLFTILILKIVYIKWDVFYTDIFLLLNILLGVLNRKILNTYSKMQLKLVKLFIYFAHHQVVSFLV